ncbi:unnamed protein product, partial [Rhizoctonia solani]
MKSYSAPSLMSLSQEVMFILHLLIRIPRPISTRGSWKHKQTLMFTYGPKNFRELARRMPSYRGEFAPMHPKFPETSAAA